MGTAIITFLTGWLVEALCAWCRLTQSALLFATELIKESMKTQFVTLATTFATLVNGVAAPKEPATPPPPPEPGIVAEVDVVVADAQAATEAAADRALDITKRSLKLAQAQIEPLLNGGFGGEEWAVDPLGAAVAFKDRLVLTGARAQPKPLIVRIKSDGPDPAQLQEDLQVMTRILNKVVAPENNRPEEREWAMGIVVNTLGGGRRPQSLFLEDYGAVFFLNVRFPLVAPPTAAPADKNSRVERDSEWERAKDELYGGRESRQGTHGTVAGAPKAIPFDAGRVHDLRTDLLTALKNARNIRGLKPADQITVIVSGPGAVMRKAPRAEESREDGSETESTRPAGTTGKESTTLVLRVKRADVEAFARNEINGEEFEKRAGIAAY